MIRRFFSRRRLITLTALVVILALSGPHAWAWMRFRQAKAALARAHPDEARRAINDCRAVWGWNRAPGVALLAARAAWQAGDAEAAIGELRSAQRLSGRATADTAFEWALIQAAGGNVTEVEEYLQQRATENPAAGPLVWESLATGYLRVYRSLDAMACLSLWLERSPNNIRALELRGQTYVSGRGVVRGSEDFRRVLELDPSREATRRRLADALISLGGYEEAASHLEILRAAHPDEPGLAARLVRCYNFVGRRDEARQILEAALAKHPDNALCLRTLGQLELVSLRLPEAEQTLRRAVAVAPEDYQAQQLLFQALQQQGKAEEAKAQLVIAEAVRERVAQIGELTSRKLPEFPLDPAVHYEMGKLLIETGRAETGERWLLTALSLDPEHRPSHLALVAYYESKGDRAKAEFHREKANPKR